MRTSICSFYILLLSVVSARAQRAPTSQQAPTAVTLRDCYRALSSDSAAFFYDAEYLLTPPGCAVLRRQARLDSLGHFRGLVQDYLLRNNVLLLAGTFRNGQKHGQFELFFSNGVPAARGNYYNGQQVGDWAYWYPSGQPRQLVRFEQGKAPTLQRFWDEQGKQLVVNGTGLWHRDEEGTRLSGAVVNGLPSGRWNRKFLDNNEFYSTERFNPDGTFRNGNIYYLHGVVAYAAEIGEDIIPLDAKQSPFLDVEDFDRAEKFMLGLPCPPVQKEEKETPK